MTMLLSPTIKPSQAYRRTGLLLVAHGSRVRESNEEIVALADALSRRVSQSGDPSLDGPVVEHAFLGLADPDIGKGIDRCVGLGVTDLTVMPYFLAAGSHVRTDIPEHVAKAQRRHPLLRVAVASHIGQSQLMLDLILSEVGLNTVESANQQ